MKHKATRLEMKLSIMKSFQRDLMFLSSDRDVLSKTVRIAVGEKAIPGSSVSFDGPVPQLLTAINQGEKTGVLDVVHGLEFLQSPRGSSIIKLSQRRASIKCHNRRSRERHELIEHVGRRICNSSCRRC